jgi:molybdate transport system substrate-binding protein
MQATRIRGRCLFLGVPLVSIRACFQSLSLREVPLRGTTKQFSWIAAARFTHLAMTFILKTRPSGFVRPAFLLFFAITSLRAADTVSVAAAANFIYALESLHAEFKRASPATTVTTATGASGSLYAQIRNGAPFDVFLSADVDYPRRIVTDGSGVSSTLTIFATGRLVAWTLRPDVDLSDLRTALRSASVRKIAIAQPRTAPYGRAAQVALEKLGVWTEAERKVVVGESISQTAQFVETGNADLGFVALSLVLSPQLAKRGHWVELPPECYAYVSLDHAAVLTVRGAANSAAKRYLEFLSTDAAKKILREFGYGVK